MDMESQTRTQGSTNTKKKNPVEMEWNQNHPSKKNNKSFSIEKNS